MSHGTRVQRFRVCDNPERFRVVTNPKPQCPNRLTLVVLATIGTGVTYWLSSTSQMYSRSSG